MAISENIKAIRVGLGLSQAKFAQEVGVNTMTVSRWERAIVKPKPKHRKRIRALMEEEVVGEETGNDGAVAGYTGT